MSDEEYEYSDEGSEQGGNDQEDENEVEIEIENGYYEGDECKTENPKRAIEMFDKVLTLDRNKLFFFALL